MPMLTDGYARIIYIFTLMHLAFFAFLNMRLHIASAVDSVKS